MRTAMITTTDNPFDPFTQFDEWMAFDVNNGYNSWSYIDRVAHTSIEMSEPDFQQAIEDAIDEIVKLNVTGNYKKVVRDVEQKVFKEEQTSQ